MSTTCLERNTRRFWDASSPQGINACRKSTSGGPYTISKNMALSLPAAVASLADMSPSKRSIRLDRSNDGSPFRGRQIDDGDTQSSAADLTCLV